MVFNCQYYDERVVQIPRANLTFEALYNALLQQFQVFGLTVMHGERFLEAQRDLDDVLSDGSSSYQLLLYDYDPSYNTNSYYDNPS